MIEFFQTFNESFYGVIDQIAFMFPFCLTLSLIVAPIIAIIEHLKHK